MPQKLGANKSHQRQIVKYHKAGAKAAEIAGAMGIPVETVESFIDLHENPDKYNPKAETEPEQAKGKGK